MKVGLKDLINICISFKKTFELNFNIIIYIFN
jgi:hypothetical protein